MRKQDGLLGPGGQWPPSVWKLQAQAFTSRWAGTPLFQADGMVAILINVVVSPVLHVSGLAAALSVRKPCTIYPLVVTARLELMTSAAPLGPLLLLIWIKTHLLFY